MFVYERVPEYVADAALLMDDVQSYEQDSVPDDVLLVFETAVHNLLQVWVFIEHVHDEDDALHAPKSVQEP